MNNVKVKPSTGGKEERSRPAETHQMVLFSFTDACRCAFLPLITLIYLPVHIVVVEDGVNAFHDQKLLSN